MPHCWNPLSVAVNAHLWADPDIRWVFEHKCLAAHFTEFVPKGFGMFSQRTRYGEEVRR
jgi:hypothetical protein